jgi:hypothetical protein
VLGTGDGRTVLFLPLNTFLGADHRSLQGRRSAVIVLARVGAETHLLSIGAQLTVSETAKFPFIVLALVAFDVAYVLLRRYGH